MTKLEELIEKLCPDGVEYKTVGEIANISRGKVMSKDYLKNNIGEYPVYSSQTENNGQLGAITTYMYDGDYLTWTTDGANAGTVFFRSGKFSITNVCGLIDVKDNNLMPKFLYYFLNKEAPNHVKSGMGNPKLMSNVMSNIKLPVPPLEVQREIVRILDNFTFLTAELAAELAARQKQYEYYRDLLLTFKPNESTILNERTNELELSSAIRWMKLGDTCLHSCSGATPKKSNSEYYVGGTVPWIRTQNVTFNNIYSVDSFITEKAVQETAAKWIPENCVIVAISGASAGRCAINKIKATTNQHCLNMEIDSSKALYKYVFYCLCNQYEELLSKKQGARGDLNSSLILDTLIPVPPLEVQQRIVGILDRFDALCNDITSGLPAEIEARQKQYEYYRDKLLTFKELKKEA